MGDVPSLGARAANRRLALSVDQAPADAVAGALEAVLIYAFQNASRYHQNQARAVHEYRKSLRRARALMRIVRPTMSSRRHRRIALILKQAHRDTSALRDAEVLVDTLDRYELAVEHPESARIVREKLVARQAKKLRPKRVGRILARGCEAFAKTPGLLRRALPDQLDDEQLLEGLRRTYRTARRHQHNAAEIADPAHIHSWRKRSKDIVYQLELLTPIWGTPLRDLRRQFSALTTALGEVTDLHILREHVTVESRRADEQHQPMLARIDELLAERIRSAIDSGGPLFELSPWEWVAWLTDLTQERESARE